MIVPSSLITLTSLFGAVDGEPTVCSGLLAQISPDGRAARGSKAAVRRAVADGRSLRVGWYRDPDGDGRPDIIHWDDAGFLSIFEGDVFAQLRMIHRQRAERSNAAVHLAEEPEQVFLLLGTNGRLESRLGTKSVRRRSVTSWWCEAGGVSDRCESSWRLVYRHDREGKGLEGRKSELFDAVRRGQSIRLAWGHELERGGEKISAEHAVDPIFLTIASKKELSVQVPEHLLQSSYHRPSQVRFDGGKVLWRGLLSTDGSFDAIMVDRATGETLRRLPQRTEMAWFAFGPPASCPRPTPVRLAVPRSPPKGS